MIKFKSSTVAIISIFIILAFAGGYLISMTVVDPIGAKIEKQNTITIQDSANRFVDVPYPVETIVVLWDNPTEEIKALGAIDRIIGIDTATKEHVNNGLYPELENVTLIGSWDEPNYEKIAELDPDVVIMLSSYAPLPEEVQKQLAPFGITVVGLDFYRDEIYLREVRTLGFMLGLSEKTDEYISFFKEKFDMISERIKDIPSEERKLVYFEGLTDYQTYGGCDYGCGVPGIIRAAGGIDLYPEIIPYSFDADPEDIAIRNPDVIIKGQEDGYYLHNYSLFDSVHKNITSRPELVECNAILDNEVYVLSFDVTGGSRKKFGPMFLAKILYPEIFKDFNPEEVLKEYLQTYLDLEWQGIYVYPEI